MTSVTLFPHNPGRTDAGLRFSDLANFGEALQDRLWVFIRLLEVLLSSCMHLQTRARGAQMQIGYHYLDSFILGPAENQG